MHRAWGNLLYAVTALVLLTGVQLQLRSHGSCNGGSATLMIRLMQTELMIRLMIRLMWPARATFYQNLTDAAPCMGSSRRTTSSGTSTRWTRFSTLAATSCGSCAEGRSRI